MSEPCLMKNLKERRILCVDRHSSVSIDLATIETQPRLLSQFLDQLSDSDVRDGQSDQAQSELSYFLSLEFPEKRPSPLSDFEIGIVLVFSEAVQGRAPQGSKPLHGPISHVHVPVSQPPEKVVDLVLTAETEKKCKQNLLHP